MEMLRQDDRSSGNLALNMQSLGKAYDNPGYYFFPENSIRRVKPLLHA